jgi:hypothetical protein
MDLKKIEIKPEIFYIVGIYCFLIIGIMNIGNFFYSLHHQNFFTTISSWANIFFNFVLSGFFYYLFKQSNPQITEEYSSENIDDLLKQIKQKEKKE